MKNKPTDYVWIERWGRLLGSFRYYVLAQQRLAAADNAPLTAIYKRGDVWSTIDDITNPLTRRDMGLEPHAQE